MDVSRYVDEIEKLESDFQKVTLINTISDENVRVSLLGYLQDEFYKMSVIDSLSDIQLKIQALDFLEKDYNKGKIISSVEDENIRFSLLGKIKDDSYKTKVIVGFLNQELKIKALSLLNNEYRKKDVLASVTDVNLFIHGLDFVESDFIKVDLINGVEDESIRLSLLGYLRDESSKMNVIDSISNVQLKIQSLDLLKSDDRKVRIINSIEDESVRYSLLGYLQDESYKVSVIASFSDVQLKIQALDFLEKDYNKEKIISSVEDENVRYSLLGKIKDDSYKTNVIVGFLNQELKIKALSLLNNEYRKNDVLASVTDVNLFIQGLDFVESDFIKVDLINGVEDESVRFSLLGHLQNETDKMRIIDSISNVQLKIQSLDLLKSDDRKVRIINSIEDENIRYSLLGYLQSDFSKVNVIQTFGNENLLHRAFVEYELNSITRKNILVGVSNDEAKVHLLSFLDSDSLKLEVIDSVSNEAIKLNGLHSVDSIENKLIILSGIHDNNIVKNGLDMLDNYKEAMRNLFDKGNFCYLYSFDNDILYNVFDDKKVKILNEYKKINDEKIRDVYSSYIIRNFEDIQTNQLSDISMLLSRIEMSNSSELRAFGDKIANQVLNQENPIKFFDSVEDIFVKNNIPYVGKVFEVFKLLHNKQSDYRNDSPMLNRFKDSKHSVQMMDLIIFNDLIKCAFGSNNKSLKNFLNNIEDGNMVLNQVMKDVDSIHSLDNHTKIDLSKYLDKIEIMLDNYDHWKAGIKNPRDNKELLFRIQNVVHRLQLQGDNYSDIPDILVRKFCGFAGIDSFSSAKRYFDYIVSSTNQRNMDSVNRPFVLEEGDFVKGLGDFKYLHNILQNGSVCKEFLGDAANTDLTPLDTDLARILPEDLDGKKSNELGKIIRSTESSSYGNIYVVLKNNLDRIEVTRDMNGERQNYKSNRFLKLEAFKTRSAGHYGIRTGFPSSEISYFVSDNHIDRIGLEIAMNGFYIPVVDSNGKLVFTVDDYQNLTSKMQGLSYYDNSQYSISENLESDDILAIRDKMKDVKRVNKERREAINKTITSALAGVGLSLKNEMDGNLEVGNVEFIDTGSTGRDSNILGDDDFDFVMRLDNEIMLDDNKKAKVKDALLDKLGREHRGETVNGNFRFTNVKIDGVLDPINLDISFIPKTDKIEYSSDYCLVDRYRSIKEQYPDKYDTVLANVIEAKMLLKSGEVYKKQQGGISGIGVENWILQNGGSLYDAAKSFVEVADGKDLNQFKKVYSVWDFGENQFTEERRKNYSNFYAHDNYLDYLTDAGYFKMQQVLGEYLNKVDNKIQSDVNDMIIESEVDKNNININANADMKISK